MDVLPTRIDPQSEAFRANQRHHEALRTDLRELLDRIREGGPEKARAKHHERGKLLARERIDRLLDPGSPFLELSALAAAAPRDVSPTARTAVGMRRW